jgi:hypothetical protein
MMCIAAPASRLRARIRVSTLDRMRETFRLMLGAFALAALTAVGCRTSASSLGTMRPLYQTADQPGGAPITTQPPVTTQPPITQPSPTAPGQSTLQPTIPITPQTTDVFDGGMGGSGLTTPSTPAYPATPGTSDYDAGSLANPLGTPGSTGIGAPGSTGVGAPGTTGPVGAPNDVTPGTTRVDGGTF